VNNRIAPFTDDEKAEIRADLGIDPDTFYAVMSAFNHLLHGEIESYGREIKAAQLAQGVDVMMENGPMDSIAKSRAICVAQIAIRWGVSIPEAGAKLQAVAAGLAEPPTELLEGSP
jgi:hypothetical protein